VVICGPVICFFIKIHIGLRLTFVLPGCRGKEAVKRICLCGLRRQVHVRVLQNTVEQFVMSFVSQLTLSTWLDASQMSIVPIVAVLFVVGRVMFWIGYLNPADNRTGRGPGTCLTFLPTLAMIVYNIYKLVITTACI